MKYYLAQKKKKSLPEKGRVEGGGKKAKERLQEVINLGCRKREKNHRKSWKEVGRKPAHK